MTTRAAPLSSLRLISGCVTFVRGGGTITAHCSQLVSEEMDVEESKDGRGPVDRTGGIMVDRLALGNTAVLALH